MYQFLILFTIVVVFAYILERILLNVLGFFLFRILVIPGIIVHELSHAIIAIIFGSKIKSIKVFKKEGGEVGYSKPKFPIISQPLISIFPVIGATLVLYAVSLAIGFSWDQILSESKFSFDNIKNIFINFPKDNWFYFLFLYLILSLTASMGPSKKDVVSAVGGLVFLLIISVAIFYFIPQSLVFWDKLSMIYLISLYLLIIGLAVSIVLWIVKSLIRLIL